MARSRKVSGSKSKRQSRKKNCRTRKMRGGEGFAGSNRKLSVAPTTVRTPMPKPSGPAPCPPAYVGVRKPNGNIECIPLPPMAPIVNTYSRNNFLAAENAQRVKNEERYARLIKQLSNRPNTNKYTNKGEEVNQFIKEEHIRNRMIEREFQNALNSAESKGNYIRNDPTRMNEVHNYITNTVTTKKMKNGLKKRINEIKQAVLTQKEREDLLINDVKDDGKVLEIIQTKNNTVGQEPTDAELALLVAMKIFNQIQIFRASGCPALLSDPKFIVDFPSMGSVNGKDLSYRRKGLELLKDKYKELMEKKQENQKVESGSFQNRLKATYKMARNTAGRTLGKAVGISKRVSRSEVPLFLDKLIKDGAVSKKVCEWQPYAFRFEIDFGFPNVKMTVDPNNPGKTLSEAELKHMAARAAAIGTGLLVSAIVGTTASIAMAFLDAIGQSTFAFFQMIGSILFGGIA